MLPEIKRLIAVILDPKGFESPFLMFFFSSQTKALSACDQNDISIFIYINDISEIQLRMLNDSQWHQQVFVDFGGLGFGQLLSVC